MHYEEKTFDLPEMEGLSTKQIETHLKLYSGYIKNVNGLMDDINTLKQDSEKNARALSELARRFGFEWNGMRMHEYYFEALGGDGKPGGEIVNLIEDQYGSIDTWMAEFRAIAMMRGAGWAVLTLDTESGNLHSIWVNDHELGQLAGAKVLIALDVWEHAYLIDYLPAGRGDYITAFFNNLKWDVIERRLTEAQK
tara:strand:- start:5639 stop:6223 length:585 start_codon:yes stop_codon:yes gene_type:complete